MSSAAVREPADQASFEAGARVAELFEEHGRMTFGICRAMLRDVHEAEDAMQQSFLSAHRALLGGADVRDGGAWIATIARNECRARISARMRNPLPVGHDDLAELPGEADVVESGLRAGELVDALSELPERQREAVFLRYVYGLRYAEVSTALGLSLPATEALLFRARRAMRLRLRHATAAVLVVPVSVRDELASALPGFDSQTGAGAGAGLAGGVLAKLLSAPAAAKIATATVAASAVGAVGIAQSNETPRGLLQATTVTRDALSLSAAPLASPATSGVDRTGQAAVDVSSMASTPASAGNVPVAGRPVAERTDAGTSPPPGQPGVTGEPGVSEDGGAARTPAEVVNPDPAESAGDRSGPGLGGEGAETAGSSSVAEHSSLEESSNSSSSGPEEASPGVSSSGPDSGPSGSDGGSGSDQVSADGGSAGGSAGGGSEDGGS